MPIIVCPIDGLLITTFSHQYFVVSQSINPIGCVNPGKHHVIQLGICYMDDRTIKDFSVVSDKMVLNLVSSLHMACLRTLGYSNPPIDIVE